MTDSTQTQQGDQSQQQNTQKTSGIFGGSIDFSDNDAFDIVLPQENQENQMMDVELDLEPHNIVSEIPLPNEDYIPKTPEYTPSPTKEFSQEFGPTDDVYIPSKEADEAPVVAPIEAPIVQQATPRVAPKIEEIEETIEPEIEEEAPVIEQAPVTKEAPVVKEIPVMKKAPVVTPIETPVAEQAPVVKKEKTIEHPVQEKSYSETKKKFSALMESIDKIFSLSKIPHEEGIKLIGANNENMSITYTVNLEAGYDSIVINKTELQKEEGEETHNQLKFVYDEETPGLDIILDDVLLYQEEDFMEDNKKKLQVFEKINKFMFLLTEEEKKWEKIAKENEAEQQEKRRLQDIFRNF